MIGQIGTAGMAARIAVSQEGGSMTLEALLHGISTRGIGNRFPREFRGYGAAEVEALKAQWAGNWYAVSLLECR